MSEKNTPEDDAFHLAAATALSTCQLVEHGVKLYISAAHQMIAEKVHKRIPYHFSGEDYEEVPLRGLLKIFGKLNDNKDLQKRLENFRPTRNWVAHQLFADYFTKAETKEHQEKVLTRLKKLEADAASLMVEIFQEYKDLRAANEKSNIDVAAIIQQAAGQNHSHS